MNKDTTPPIPIRNIIFRFNLIDWFQVFKMLFWINITYLILAGIYLNFFKVLNFFSVRFLQINLYEKEKDATNFISELVTGINQSGDNFLGGKFFLWFCIIYVCLFIYARYENTPINYNINIPVLSYPVISLIAVVILIFGFSFNEVGGFYFFWILFVAFVFFSLFFTSKVFKTVYLREFPDEYKKDFGDSKP